MGRLKVAAWLWLFVSMVAGLVILVHSPIKQVVMKGETKQLGGIALQAMVEPYFKNGVLQVSLERLKQALTANQWIRHVALKRVWPDTLEIEIEEKTPIARWGKALIMDAQGGLFSPPTVLSLADLPYVNAPKNFQESVYRFMQALYQTQQLDRHMLVSLGYHASLGWSLILGTGAEIHLDQPLTIEQAKRLGRALKVIRQEKGLNKLRLLDARYANGFVVTYRGNGG